MLGCLTNILWNFLIQPESQCWHTHWAQLWRHMGLIGRNHRCDCWTKKGSASFGFAPLWFRSDVQLTNWLPVFFVFIFCDTRISYVSKIMYEQNYAYVYSSDLYMINLCCAICTYNLSKLRPSLLRKSIVPGAANPIDCSQRQCAALTFARRYEGEFRWWFWKVYPGRNPERDGKL